MELTAYVPKPLWIDRFENALSAVCPELDPQMATAHAEASFDDAADLAPEEAAEIFALEAAPADFGHAGD